MNIHAYRRKFILIAMSAMAACLVVLLLMINLFNAGSVVAEQKDIDPIEQNRDRRLFL